jgi:hypothetical protein
VGVASSQACKFVKTSFSINAFSEKIVCPTDCLVLLDEREREKQREIYVAIALSATVDGLRSEG